MTKIRRGSYVFITWKGDHSPRHIHVYKEGRLIVKWSVIEQMPMKGVASRRVRKLLRELIEEGEL